ncbi:MAG: hypothetical protein J0L72_02255 [Armatimonadetes bacterium]|nr:hypothetical protein [Armatimonadota bacterium]
MSEQNTINTTPVSAGKPLMWASNLPHRFQIAYLNWTKSRTESKSQDQQLTIRDRQAELIEFYSRFETLVELLCDSAQYGPEPRMEAKYAELRQWMQRNYSEIRPYVVAYLEVDLDDSNGQLDQYGAAPDAFESLFGANTLDELLRGDGGTLIGRIMRTREAVNRYAEHLRRLAA